METIQYKCKLCGQLYSYQDMSEEHYPARSVGNEEVVAFDIVKMLDAFQNVEIQENLHNRLSNGESFEKNAGDIFDNELSKPLYPKERTARTLCRNCNTFLGKYDAAYLKFFSQNGNSQNTSCLTPAADLVWYFRLLLAVFFRLKMVLNSQR